MTQETHLWAVAFDQKERAEQAREVISELAWGIGEGGRSLILQDIAVVERHPDGSFTFNRQPFPGVRNIVGCTAAGFLAGLALGAPLIGAAVGVAIGGAGTAITAASAGISNGFVREVETLMKPETSALFVLDDAGDMDAILHAIRGLGGTVLKTNVDPEQLKLIQSTLSASAGTIQKGAS
jgi:uncharacterized membrane protein